MSVYVSHRFPELQPGAGDGRSSRKLAKDLHFLPRQNLHVLRELQDLRRQSYTHISIIIINKRSPALETIKDVLLITVCELIKRKNKVVTTRLHVLSI